MHHFIYYLQGDQRKQIETETLTDGKKKIALKLKLNLN